MAFEYVENLEHQIMRITRIDKKYIKIDNNTYSI